jgi:hypothetical protein
MRVATGEQVHPTVTSFLEHYKGPPLVAVPITDLPPSEAALVWRTADRNAKIRSFVRAATDVLNRHHNERTDTASLHPPFRSLA